MSQITMGNTYESNYYGQYIGFKLLLVIHMCQITMGNTKEVNYYG